METRKPIIKVTMLGNEEVGKTALFKRYVSDKFNSAYHSTSGIDFKTKQHVDSDESIQLWDTSGQEKFRVINTSFCQGAQAMLIVFDMTKDAWEKELKHQLQRNFNEFPKDAAIFIVGTKKDLVENVNILKEKEIALQSFVANKEMLAQIHPNLANKPVHWATTSAKTGDGIDALFETVVKTVHEMRDSAKTTLAARINQICRDQDFWKTKVRSYAHKKGETSPDGVNQIHAEKTITLVADRLQKIGKDAKFKRSSTALAEWFHSYFRSRHPATEEFYQILSKLDNFSEKTVADVMKELERFEKKYSPADDKKKQGLTDLINSILETVDDKNHPMHEKFSHAGVTEIKINKNNLERICSAAEKNHSSFPRLHLFSQRIPDPKLNELYGILRELKELDNATVDKVTRKLHKFKVDMVKISRDNTLRRV